MQLLITQPSLLKTGVQTLLAPVFLDCGASLDTNGDNQAIDRIVPTYAQRIDRADSMLAKQWFTGTLAVTLASAWRGAAHTQIQRHSTEGWSKDRCARLPKSAHHVECDHRPLALPIKQLRQ
jgi:hypothetical protein